MRPQIVDASHSDNSLIIRDRFSTIHTLAAQRAPRYIVLPDCCVTEVS